MATDTLTGIAIPGATSNDIPSASVVESWTAKQLFVFIESQNILGDDANREKFQNAEIIGIEFLSRGDADDFWLHNCRLPASLSAEFAVLVQKIKGISEDSDIGKRHARKRTLSPSGEQGDDADRRKILRHGEAILNNEMKTLRSRIAKVSPDLSRYCDPRTKQMLPFPYPRKIPSRFQLDGDGCFEFYGRPKFLELYTAACSMNCATNSRYFFHGTLGAGKSHLLAALACLLMRQGKLVVYVPDCYQLLLDPAEYLGAALEFPFYDSELFASKLKKLRLQWMDEAACHESLKMLCRHVAKHHDEALFIVDQANALDDAEQGTDRFDNARKQAARTLLDTCMEGHMKLSSSTSIYKNAQADMRREMYEKRIDLYHGLNDKEMEAWWSLYGNALSKRLHPSLPLSKDEKIFLEELTGRMPLFLRNLRDCVPSETPQLGAKFLAPADLAAIAPRLTHLYDHVCKSEEVQQLFMRITYFWDNYVNPLEDESQQYCAAILACLTNSQVDPKAMKYLDWRYFFVDQNGIGHTTCGFATHVAKCLLLTVVDIRNSHDRLWEASLRQSGKNRAMLAFHVEYLVLRKILHQGCLTAGPEFGKAGNHIVFGVDMPPPLRYDFKGCMLYIPSSYNYRAVDGILVYRSGGVGEKSTKAKAGDSRAKGKAAESSTKAIVVGIQIAVPASHSDSESKFFRNWNSWTSNLQCDEIEFRFLWIVRDVGRRKRKEVIPACVLETGNSTNAVVPMFTRLVASVKEVAPVTGVSLEKALQLARNS